nr:hypothetical protein [Actinomycetota bacterium]
MKGAAWSVPVLAIAVAAPAMAISPRDIGLVGIGSFAVQRCGQITGLSFCAKNGGAAAPAGWTVQVTLPAGLQFASGNPTTQNLTTTAGGCVSVPTIRVTGAAGSYSITGTITAPVSGPAGVAQITGTVSVAPGNVKEFRTKYTWGDQASAVTYVRDTALSASEGGIAGNNAGNSFGAVVAADGTVRYWTGNTSWTGGTVSPSTLPTVAGATQVSTFRANGSAFGGAAASASAVWQWWDAGSGPTVLAVTGPTGTVLDVQSFAGRSYVLTTNGVWTWTTATSGSGSIAATALSLPAGTAAGSRIIQMSAFYDMGNNDTGAAVIIGASGSATSGQLALSTGGGNFSNVTGTGSADIRTVSAGSAGLAAIGTNGTLYTYANYAHAGIPTGWTQRDTGVSSASVWGFGGYFGGQYVKNGAVVQMFGVSGGYTTKVPTGMTGKTITKTFSSDGTYLALASDGTVYYWYGNNDNFSGSGAPAAAVLPGVTNVVDLNVWGYHYNSGVNNYFGGGFVIQGSGCP